MRVKFRIVLPVVYVLVVGYMFFLSLGDAKGLAYIPVVSFPVVQLLQWLFGEPQSWFRVLLYVAVTALHWFMWGYIIDSVFLRRR